MRYPQIQHCLFHSETKGAPGSLTQLHISPMTLLTSPLHPPTPPSPSPCVCHILTLPSRSLLFPYNAMSESSTRSVSLYPCSFPSISLCFQCPALFLLPFMIDIRYESGLSWQPSFGTYSELMCCECSKKDQKDESRSAAGGRKSISVWLHWD